MQKPFVNSLQRLADGILFFGAIIQTNAHVSITFLWDVLKTVAMPE